MTKALLIIDIQNDYFETGNGTCWIWKSDSNERYLNFLEKIKIRIHM
jgi:hypothetical protein